MWLDRSPDPDNELSKEKRYCPGLDSLLEAELDTSSDQNCWFAVRSWSALLFANEKRSPLSDSEDSPSLQAAAFPDRSCTSWLLAWKPSRDLVCCTPACDIMRLLSGSAWLSGACSCRFRSFSFGEYESENIRLAPEP